jgi:hypothetical protein
MAAVQLPLRVLAMPPLEARLPPVPASQLRQRALDRQRGLSGIPSFTWLPGLAPEVGRFPGSKWLLL